MNHTRTSARVGVVCLLLFTACASAQVTRTAIASREFIRAVARIQSTLDQLRDRSLISAEFVDDCQPTFLKLAVTDKAINAALRTGDGTSARIQIGAALQLLDDLMTNHVVKLKPNEQAVVQVSIDLARTILISLSIGVS